MYLRFEVVQEALSALERLHPFFGITFLVCKRGRLPVGKTAAFAVNRKELEFLEEFFKPDPRSKCFFQPFLTSSRAGRWLSPKYPFSGSQSTRTRGLLSEAFIHTRKTDLWGWKPNYIEVLKSRLSQDKLSGIPAFWLAVWIYRRLDWPRASDTGALESRLFSEFSISEKERRELFISHGRYDGELYSDEPYSDKRLLQVVEAAPDSSPEEGGTLRLLEISGIGPSAKVSFYPAERLSIITGDNGLGKSFILECAWWSLTGQWAERPAYPNPSESRGPAAITFEITVGAGPSRPKTIRYDWEAQRWPAPKGRPTLPGLVVYARVDGSFAVWDPARHVRKEDRQRDAALVFSRDEVLQGLEGKMEGLLRDWVKWQSRRDQATTFDTFRAVLNRLSPPDMAPLAPGPTIRVPGEAREIPTLHHPYGDVPFTNESAGVRRIVTLAYLLVWSWTEHKISSALSKRPPQRQLVILIDEVEAHLHPKWQRVVLPALLDVATLLSNELQYQAIVATHSPLILASIESQFVPESDKLFHLRLTKDGDAAFLEIPFVRYGPVERWLTSDIFELPQARSREGELALEEAKKVLSDANPDREAIRLLSARLSRILPQDDPFWPRWLYFAESKGAKP
jgi:hypothetical protein